MVRGSVGWFNCLRIALSVRTSEKVAQTGMFAGKGLAEWLWHIQKTRDSLPNSKKEQASCMNLGRVVCKTTISLLKRRQGWRSVCSALPHMGKVKESWGWIRLSHQKSWPASHGSDNRMAATHSAVQMCLSVHETNPTPPGGDVHCTSTMLVVFYDAGFELARR